jgi:hypothetical protein
VVEEKHRGIFGTTTTETVVVNQVSGECLFYDPHVHCTPSIEKNPSSASQRRGRTTGSKSNLQDALCVCVQPKPAYGYGAAQPATVVIEEQRGGLFRPTTETVIVQASPNRPRALIIPGDDGPLR